MWNKYKLTKESIEVDGHTLYRIVALKNFGTVKKGEKGGFIENENNLSQEGKCWVYGNAKVFERALVSGSAKVKDLAEVREDAVVTCRSVIHEKAKVYGSANVRDNVEISSFAKVYGNARVYDDAKISGCAEVYENAEVSGEAIVFGDAKVYGSACVDCFSELSDNAKVYGGAKVLGHAEIFEYAEVFEFATVEDAKIRGNAVVKGRAKVYGHITIKGTSVISNDSDYIVFKNWWSSGRYFTWTRSNNMWSVGCFYGDGDELIEKAYKHSELSGREYGRAVKYVREILDDEKSKVEK